VLLMIIRTALLRSLLFLTSKLIFSNDKGPGQLITLWLVMQ